MRTGIMTHNPFQFAQGKEVPRVKVEARFEIRARILRQIEKIDSELESALRLKSFDRAEVEKLAAKRNELMAELPA